MSSEFYVFKDGGKDNAARRALFSTFIGLVAPELCQGEEETRNIDVQQDRHFAGFRKSAGIWYNSGDKEVYWDRRLVLWMRSKSGFTLPFYDNEDKLVTVDGKPLIEAAVCTLEIVLRNTATYSIGFLLMPKYKRHQCECISKASSWIVLGYFPFPKGVPGSVQKITNCETDQEKIRSLLLANLPQRTEVSSRVSAREGDFKPSVSVNANKRTSNTRCLELLKKRRVSPAEENMKKSDHDDEPCKPAPEPAVVEEPMRVEGFMWNTQEGEVNPMVFDEPRLPAAESCSAMKDEKDVEDSYIPWKYADGDDSYFFCPSPASVSMPSPVFPGSETEMKDQKEDDDYLFSPQNMFFFEDGIDPTNIMCSSYPMEPSASSSQTQGLFPRSDSLDQLYPEYYSMFGFKKEE